MHATWLAGSIALASCGRISFDDRADADRDAARTESGVEGDDRAVPIDAAELDGSPTFDGPATPDREALEASQGPEADSALPPDTAGDASADAGAGGPVDVARMPCNIWRVAVDESGGPVIAIDDVVWLATARATALGVSVHYPDGHHELRRVDLRQLPDGNLAFQVNGNVLSDDDIAGLAAFPLNDGGLLVAYRSFLAGSRRALLNDDLTLRSQTMADSARCTAHQANDTFIEAFVESAMDTVSLLDRDAAPTGTSAVVATVPATSQVACDARDQGAVVGWQSGMTCFVAARRPDLTQRIAPQAVAGVPMCSATRVAALANGGAAVLTRNGFMLEGPDSLHVLDATLTPIAAPVAIHDLRSERLVSDGRRAFLATSGVVRIDLSPPFAMREGGAGYADRIDLIGDELMGFRVIDREVHVARVCF